MGLYKWRTRYLYWE